MGSTHPAVLMLNPEKKNHTPIVRALVEAFGKTCRASVYWRPDIHPRLSIVEGGFSMIILDTHLWPILEANPTKAIEDDYLPDWVFTDVFSRAPDAICLVLGNPAALNAVTFQLQSVGAGIVVRSLPPQLLQDTNRLAEFLKQTAKDYRPATIARFADRVYEAVKPVLRGRKK